VIEKVTHGSMGRRWYWETSMVARCTRREETTGISSRAYGLSALCQCLTLHVTSTDGYFSLAVGVHAA